MRPKTSSVPSWTCCVTAIAIAFVLLTALNPSHDLSLLSMCGALALAALVFVSNAGLANESVPAPFLTYENARIPQALIAAGRVMRDEGVIWHGLRSFEWLLHVQTEDGLNQNQGAESTLPRVCASRNFSDLAPRQDRQQVAGLSR